MLINGLRKMTLLDYPGKCACTVFLAGCNLRCPYCHNASLVTGQPPENLSQDELFSFLTRRKGLLDGVCITGGEPTLRTELPDFIRKIKDMGFLVKLDTNGSNPTMLSRLIQAGLVDRVAMDIKNSPELYTPTCGGREILPEVRESVSILMEGAVEYEFRTICCKPFHTVEAMESIGKWLSGAKEYYLQNFVDSGDLVGTGVSGLTREEMEALHQAVLPHIPGARIRGI